MLAEEMIDKNPMQRIRPPRVPDEQLVPVSVEQVRALLQVCDVKVGMGARDRAILLCLWDSGCRASELTALDVGDLDLQTGALLVRQGKGRKHRVTFLGAKTRREVLRYLRQRGDPGPNEPLFLNQAGQAPLLRDAARRSAPTRRPSRHRDAQSAQLSARLCDREPAPRRRRVLAAEDDGPHQPGRAQALSTADRG